MRSSIRAACASGVTALLLLGCAATGTVALADTPVAAPATALPLTVTAIRELADPLTGLQAAQNSQGAYRGDVTVVFSLATDPGQQLLPYDATVTYPTRSGGTATGTADVYGSTGYFTLDTRNLPDGDHTLTVSALEGVDQTSTDTTPVTGTLDLDTANPSAVFTSPTQSSVVWGPVTWSVAATPATGGSAIARVEFYANGYGRGSKPTYVATSAPYSYTTDATFPTSYSGMEAVAVDADGYRSEVTGVGVAVEPGPTVTASGDTLLDAEGTQQLFVTWSGAVASGLNYDPSGYNATTWLTTATISVDGRVLESDDLQTSPLQCPITAYHCLHSVPWTGEYNLSGLAVGSHRVTVTVGDNLGGVGTASYTVVVGADKLTATAPGRLVALGGSVGVYGDLTGATGSLLPGARLALEARLAGGTAWTTVATQTVNSNVYDLSTVPRQNESLRVVELGGTKQVSATFAVTVQPKVTGKASASTVRRGQSVKVTGQVVGKSPGAVVRLLVDRAGKWVTLASTRQSATGTVSFTVPERTSGTLYYRLYSPATTAFGDSYGPLLTVHVH